MRDSTDAAALATPLVEWRSQTAVTAMRHVFLPLDSSDGPAFEVSLEIAARLAEAVGGRLTIVRETDLDAPTGEWSSAVLMQRAGLSPEHKALLDRHHVPLQMSESRDALGTACRLAAAERGIVIMMDRSEAEIGMALVDHGLPVLAAPRGAKPLDAAGEALVLWDGSKSAGHALAAALPLLRCAGRVTILEIDDGSLRRPSSEAVALLARHGIAAHLQHDLAFGEKAGLLLLEQIAAIAPAYVVMGGFGHARWIESAVGGVTRRLLGECDVPLFLKH